MIQLITRPNLLKKICLLLPALWSLTSVSCSVSMTFSLLCSENMAQYNGVKCIRVYNNLQLVVEGNDTSSVFIVANREDLRATHIKHEKRMIELGNVQSYTSTPTIADINYFAVLELSHMEYGGVALTNFNYSDSVLSYVERTDSTAHGYSTYCRNDDLRNITGDNLFPNVYETRDTSRNNKDTVYWEVYGLPIKQSRHQFLLSYSRQKRMFKYSRMIRNFLINQ